MLPVKLNTVHASGSTNPETSITSIANHTNQTNGKTILWAKMPGFAHWPARYCTPHENSVLTLTKSAKKGEKTNYASVAFLGNSYQR